MKLRNVMIALTAGLAVSGPAAAMDAKAANELMTKAGCNACHQ